MRVSADPDQMPSSFVSGPGGVRPDYEKEHDFQEGAQGEHHYVGPAHDPQSSSLTQYHSQQSTSSSSSGKKSTFGLLSHLANKQKPTKMGV